MKFKFKLTAIVIILAIVATFSVINFSNASFANAEENQICADLNSKRGSTVSSYFTDLINNAIDENADVDISGNVDPDSFEKTKIELNKIFECIDSESSTMKYKDTLSEIYNSLGLKSGDKLPESSKFSFDDLKSEPTTDMSCTQTVQQNANKSVLGRLYYEKYCLSNIDETVLDRINEDIVRVNRLIDAIDLIKSGNFDKLSPRHENALTYFLDNQTLSGILNKIHSTSVFDKTDNKFLHKEHVMNIMNEDGLLNVHNIMFVNDGVYDANPSIILERNGKVYKDCYLGQHAVTLGKQKEYDLSKVSLACSDTPYTMNDGDIFSFKNIIAGGKDRVYSKSKFAYSSKSTVAIGFVSTGTTLNNDLKLCGFSENIADDDLNISNNPDPAKNVHFKHSDLVATMENLKEQGEQVFYNLLYFMIPEFVGMVISAIQSGGAILPFVIGAILCFSVDVAMSYQVFGEIGESNKIDFDTVEGSQIQYLFKSRPISKDRLIDLTKYIQENAGSQYITDGKLRISNFSFVQETAQITNPVVYWKDSKGEIHSEEYNETSSAQHALQNILDNTSEKIETGSEIWIKAKNLHGNEFKADESNMYIYDPLSPYQAGYVANIFDEDSEIHLVALSSNSAKFVAEMMPFINENVSSFSAVAAHSTPSEQTDALLSTIDMNMFSNKIYHYAALDVDNDMIKSDMSLIADPSKTSSDLSAYFTNKISEDSQFLNQDNLLPTQKSLINALHSYILVNDDSGLAKTLATIKSINFIKNTTVYDSPALNIPQSFFREKLNDNTLSQKRFSNHCENDDKNAVIADGDEHHLICTMTRNGSTKESEKVNISTIDFDNMFIGGERGECDRDVTETAVLFQQGVSSQFYNICYFGDVSNFEPVFYSVEDKDVPFLNTDSRATSFAIPDNTLVSLNCEKNSDSKFECDAVRASSFGQRNYTVDVRDETGNRIKTLDVNFANGSNSASFSFDDELKDDSYQIIDSSSYGDLTDEVGNSKDPIDFTQLFDAKLSFDNSSSKYMHHVQRAKSMIYKAE